MRVSVFQIGTTIGCNPPAPELCKRFFGFLGELKDIKSPVKRKITTLFACKAYEVVKTCSW